MRAVPWLRRLVAGLSPRRHGFAPELIYVGFVVDKVALGQIFLRVLRFSPVNMSFHAAALQIHITWGMNNMSASGSSSETYSHPINKKEIYEAVVAKFRTQSQCSSEGTKEINSLFRSIFETITSEMRVRLTELPPSAYNAFTLFIY
jgi:hypothetical protein